MNKKFTKLSNLMIAMGILLFSFPSHLSARGESGTAQDFIAVSIPSADHGWTGGIVWWANHRVEQLRKKNPSVKFQVVTAGSPTKQIGDIENLVVNGANYLVVIPFESAPLTPTIYEIAQKGVKVLVIDRGLTRQDFGYINIAGDNAALGKISGEWVAKQMLEKSNGGKLVCLEGLPVEINTIRMDNFFTEIKKYPQIEVLDSQLANWSTQKGLEIMETYLQKYPHIDAVYAQDDDVLKGVLQAYKESGRDDIKTMLGGAGSKDMMKMIIDGNPLVRATVTYHPSMIAKGIDYAVELIKGSKTFDFANAKKPETVVIPSELVTKDNVDKFYEPDSVY